MSINISGEMTIFKNKNNTGYYTSTNNKKPDGTYDKNFITVGFRKGVEVENFTKIKVTNGFLSHYSYENENGEEMKKFKIMILDFEVIETLTSKNNDLKSTTDNEMENIYSDDDLPF